MRIIAADFLSGVAMAMLGVAVPLAAAQEPVSSPSTEISQAGEAWVPIEWSPTKIAPGSALDFSRFLDAPAGKYGEVVVQGDRFAFAHAPDKTVRFYGTNLTHRLPFMSKADCETVATALAAQGFNAVRLHMNEQWLTASPGATDFDPAQKDKMDYLISCLRKRGIYYVMTIYSAANFQPGAIQDVPEFRDRSFRFEMKGLIMISPDAMNYMRRYAKSLLCAVNPYTGVAPKDDPALIGIELTNEDPLNLFKTNYPEFTPIFTRKCREYLAAKNGKDPSDQEVEDYYNHFLLDLQSRFYETMKKYLRDELGIRKPLSDVNCRTDLAYSMVRNEMDYADIHAYWDLYKYEGAKFGGGMFTAGQKFKSFIVKFLNPITGHWASQLEAAAPRPLGKPFACGEFNMCYPEPERAFTVPLQSALAGLQGWSMILHYGYASDPALVLQPHPERFLNVVTSPLSIFSERIGETFFTRGAVAESKITIPLVLTRDYLYSKVRTAPSVPPPRDYFLLGFSCRIGTLLVNGDEDLSKYPCVVVPADMTDIPACVRKGKWFRADANLLANLKDILPGQTPDQSHSSTGQVTLDAKAGTFAVSTPQSECLLLSDNVPSVDGAALSVTGNRTPATCFITGLDGKPLADSRRMLVLYLTDLRNTGTVIDRSGQYPVIRDQGNLPYLIRQGNVDLSVHLGSRPLPQVWALHYDGSRSKEIAPTRSQGGFTFTAQAVTDPDTYGAYELVWPEKN